MVKVIKLYNIRQYIIVYWTTKNKKFKRKKMVEGPSVRINISVIINSMF